MEAKTDKKNLENQTVGDDVMMTGGVYCPQLNSLPNTASYQCNFIGSSSSLQSSMYYIEPQDQDQGSG
jgi:hypothetical protein